MKRFVGILLGFLMLSGQLASAWADVSLQGEFEQGALVVGLAEPGSHVWLGERELTVLADGHFVFGFHRDAPEHSELLVISPDGSTEHRLVQVRQREYAVQRINGLPAGMVTPPQAVQDRIAREADLAARARGHDEPFDGSSKGFVWPVVGRVSSVYGSQRILNGESRQPHFGVDIAAPTGTPVVASADGIVQLAERDLYYTGGTVIIDHGGGVSSTYLHLSSVGVQVGDRLVQGQAIGAVGATGRVTGPHLCFRYNWFESRLDPQLLLPAMPSRDAGK